MPIFIILSRVCLWYHCAMFAKKTAQSWIDELELKPHPEGGWFRRNFESEKMIDGMRPAMTSIYSGF